jgi:predicted RNase H-like HicB family nuclease
MTIISPMSPETVAQTGQIVNVSWDLKPSPPIHEFSAIACPEEEGGYSIFAADYPGVVSQGDTLEEAKANIAEAFLAMLEAMRQHGEKLRYSRDTELEASPGCTKLRIRTNG